MSHSKAGDTQFNIILLINKIPIFVQKNVEQ